MSVSVVSVEQLWNCSNEELEEYGSVSITARVNYKTKIGKLWLIIIQENQKTWSCIMADDKYNKIVETTQKGDVISVCGTIKKRRLWLDHLEKSDKIYGNPGGDYYPIQSVSNKKEKADGHSPVIDQRIECILDHRSKMSQKKEFLVKDFAGNIKWVDEIELKYNYYS